MSLLKSLLGNSPMFDSIEIVPDSPHASDCPFWVGEPCACLMNPDSYSSFAVALDSELFPTLTDCRGCGKATRVCPEPFLCVTCTNVFEHMRHVPKTFDGGDINDDGQWRGAEICCLACHETADMQTSSGASYLTATLNCGECGEVFAEFAI